MIDTDQQELLEAFDILEANKSQYVDYINFNTEEMYETLGIDFDTDFYDDFIASIIPMFSPEFYNSAIEHICIIILPEYQQGQFSSQYAASILGRVGIQLADGLQQ